MGTVDVGGSGCVCPEHVMLKAVLSSLTYRKNDVVIMDMEAGLEHLGRGTAMNMDQFIACGTCVHLVVHQVVEFHKVDDTNKYIILEGLSSTPVVQCSLGVGIEASLNQFCRNLLIGGRLEYRSLVPLIKILSCQPQLGLHNLSDVHSGGNTKGIQTDIKRCTVLKVRHILNG